MRHPAGCGLEPVFSTSGTVSPLAGPACAADHADGRERRSERFYADLTATCNSSLDPVGGVHSAGGLSVRDHRRRPPKRRGVGDGQERSSSRRGGGGARSGRWLTAVQRLHIGVVALLRRLVPERVLFRWVSCLPRKTSWNRNAGSRPRFRSFDGRSVSSTRWPASDHARRQQLNPVGTEATALAVASWSLVPGPRIELGTPGFSVRCSTS